MLPRQYTGGSLNRRKAGKKEDRSSDRKRKSSENLDNGQFRQFSIEGKAYEESGRKRNRKTKKERKGAKIIDTKIGESDIVYDEPGGGLVEKNVAEVKEERTKVKKKKMRDKKTEEAAFDEVDQLRHEVEAQSDRQKGKSKRDRKLKHKDHLLPSDVQNREEAEQDDVYQISSGDEDFTCGMRKWIMDYNQSRPGLKILQERIDNFIVAHEAQEEQARKEREARAADGGWTVVVHHKGRKKTTDSESGVAVGSVAQAAVMDNMAKKKKTEVSFDFYRFQKREAQRNEIMTLQSKFEQDKKRIQQLRAARKFRPY